MVFTHCRNINVQHIKIIIFSPVVRDNNQSFLLSTFPGLNITLRINLATADIQTYIHAYRYKDIQIYRYKNILIQRHTDVYSDVLYRVKWRTRRSHQDFIIEDMITVKAG